MDFLTRSLAQLRDLFQSMTPAARATTGLMVVVVVISVAFLFRQSTSGPDAFLFGGEFLPSSQLRRIDAALSQAGLGGYEIESNRVRVPRGKEALYMAAIAEGEAMPADFHLILEKALKAGGIFGSKEEKRQQFKAAREHQLSLWISAMPGIEEAFVMFHESEERRDRSPTVKDRIVTASVNVQADNDDVLDAKRVKAIRRLVASAIGGKSENVTVGNIAGGAVFGGGDLAGGDAAEDAYYQRRFMFENKMKSKLLSVLAPDIPGVRIAVSAELDTTAEEITSDVKVDPKVVPVRTTESEEVTTNRNTTPGGLVGLQANQALGPTGRANAPNQPAGKSNESNSTITENTSDGIPSHVEKQSRKAPFTPTRVTATIRIPSSYWDRVWRERNKPKDDNDLPEPTQQDLDQLAENEIGQLKTAIVTLLGEEEIQGRDPFPKINITTYQSFVPEPYEGPGLAKTAMAWTGRNWSTLGMMGLATFGLVMLRSFVKSIPKTEPSAVAAAPSLHVDSDDDGDEEDDPGRTRLRLRTGPNLKDDLADMIREDPDAAASILRTWIGNAAG